MFTIRQFICRDRDNPKSIQCTPIVGTTHKYKYKQVYLTLYMVLYLHIKP